MEYIEESTQIFTTTTKIWIRKRTDPLYYILIFFGTLALVFTSYWMFVPITLVILLFAYSIKKDLIIDFSNQEISTSLKLFGFFFYLKRFQLNEVKELSFIAETRDTDGDGNIYKPFLYYLHVLTTKESYKTHCYFESKESVFELSKLIDKYKSPIKVELDMNGLAEYERRWNGE